MAARSALRTSCDPLPRPFPWWRTPLVKPLPAHRLPHRLRAPRPPWAPLARRLRVRPRRRRASRGAAGRRAGPGARGNRRGRSRVSPSRRRRGMAHVSQEPAPKDGPLVRLAAVAESRGVAAGACAPVGLLARSLRGRRDSHAASFSTQPTLGAGPGEGRAKLRRCLVRDCPVGSDSRLYSPRYRLCQDHQRALEVRARRAAQPPPAPAAASAPRGPQPAARPVATAAARRWRVGCLCPARAGLTCAP